MAARTYTLWWRDGRREVIRGHSIKGAMRRYYNRDRVDFGESGVSIVSSGEHKDFYWNRELRQWLPARRRI